MNLLTFEEAIEENSSDSKVLLLGNGFSIAQTEGDFNYDNLLNKSNIDKHVCIHNAFKVFGTVDFEEIIESLERAGKVACAYGKKNEYSEDADTVREELLQAIQDVHPDNFHSIPGSEVQSCVSFLKEFNSIFTLNYDLLLYWVSLASGQFADGFGLGDRIGNEIGPFKENADCNIYNIHGGLHLFSDEKGEVYKKCADSSGNLLPSITKTIREEKRRSLYVAEGTSQEKLRKIYSVPYLTHCYKQFKKTIENNTLFIFGHSINEKDQHIYDAIGESGVKVLYYCMFDSENLSESQGEQISLLEEKGISIKYIDANKMDVWGKIKEEATL